MPACASPAISNTPSGRGPFRKLSYSLPPGLLVRQIAGLDLGGWEIAGDGAERTLKVFLRRPVNDATTVQFDLLWPAVHRPAAAGGCAAVRSQDVTRETGTLGIYAERQLTVTSRGIVGAGADRRGAIRRAGPDRRPGDGSTRPRRCAAVRRIASRPGPCNCSFWSPGRSRSRKARPSTPSSSATRKLRMASRLELHLAGHPRSEIAVQLPPGYLLYDLKVERRRRLSRRDAPGEPGAEQNPLLIVELSAPRTGDCRAGSRRHRSAAPDDVAPQIAVPVPLEIGELALVAGGLARSHLHGDAR